MKKLSLILLSNKVTWKLNFYFLILLLFVTACSSIPKNTADSCSIFSERYLWYKYAKRTEQKWGTPIYLQLAIIKMESDFDWLAKPDRTKIFKIIPYKRPSSSFGYSQAVKGTWKQYKDETGNKLATRTRFKDSVDFIGWYTTKTEKILKISKKDSFRQYIAYHEGWGNYKYYKKNKKVILLAKKVQKQSNKYKSQLNKCKNILTTRKYILF
ncbi:MAG: lytic transglycosylase [Pelagibacteraceae bacterium TMED246]|nr:MAG: lytic transglycosylase [Pelagibacteraceae bacterium TMED246]|tara:strand:+ start:40141 stop:40776 length:636 start_codon:yes stop_codon:yes gene_type:complete